MDGSDSTVLVPQISEPWLVAVLFEGAIDRWTDLAPGPVERMQTAKVYAEQFSAAYQCWKWICQCRRVDPGSDPSDRLEHPEVVKLYATPGDWSELLVGWAIVARAQALLLRDLIDAGGPEVGRAFDRSWRQLTGHAALGFLHLTNGDHVDQSVAAARLGQVIPACDAWLVSIGTTSVHESWRERVSDLFPSASVKGSLVGGEIFRNVEV